MRNGVFGDLTLSEIDSPETVKRKFSAWAPFLRPQWLASGYLLLTPVIPCKDLPQSISERHPWLDSLQRQLVR